MYSIGQCMLTRALYCVVSKKGYLYKLQLKGGKDPTEQYSDPIPTKATKYELKQFVRSKERPLMLKHLTWSPEPKRKKLYLVNINIVETKAATAQSEEDHHIINHDAVQATETLLMLQNSESEQVNIVSDGQKGLYIQEPLSMLKNSCDEETRTSSCCLTLNESLALKFENFDLKSKISELEKKCIIHC